MRECVQGGGKPGGEGSGPHPVDGKDGAVAKWNPCDAECCEGGLAGTRTDSEICALLCACCGRRELRVASRGRRRRAQGDEEGQKELPLQEHGLLPSAAPCQSSASSRNAQEKKGTR